MVLTVSHALLHPSEWVREERRVALMFSVITERKRERERNRRKGREEEKEVYYSSSKFRLNTAVTLRNYILGK